MWATCGLHAVCMWSACGHCMRTACTACPCPCPMSTACPCPLHAYCMHTACPFRIHCTRTAHALHTRCRSQASCSTAWDSTPRRALPSRGASTNAPRRRRCARVGGKSRPSLRKSRALVWCMGYGAATCEARARPIHHTRSARAPASAGGARPMQPGRAAVPLLGSRRPLDAGGVWRVRPFSTLPTQAQRGGGRRRVTPRHAPARPRPCRPPRHQRARLRRLDGNPNSYPNPNPNPNPNPSPNPNQALHMACGGGHMAAATLLISGGAWPKCPGSQQSSPCPT